MKLREIFRFELGYQLRRLQTWLFFAVLGVVAFVAVEPNFLDEAKQGAYQLGSPFVVAFSTVMGSVFWLLGAAAVAGEAAARDVATGMHPLTYTAPVRKLDYLGGRFLAAFLLNALILLAVPVGTLLGVHAFGLQADLIGPIRPAAYLTAYGLIALPNAFIATAIQFAFAALGRRTIASYIGGMLLIVTAFVVPLINREAGQLLDPIGVFTLGRDAIANGWSTMDLNTRLIALEGQWLANRMLWLVIAGGVLAFTHSRFQFRHPTAATWWSRVARRRAAHAPAPAERAQSTPQVRRTFGFATYARQALAIGWTSFRHMLGTRTGLFMLVPVAFLAYLAALEPMNPNGVPLIPRTDFVLRALSFPEIPPAYFIIPLLIIFCAGELVWREREARMSAIVDAAPVPEGVLFLGKFLGLGLVVALCMAIRMAAGIFVQLSMGYYEIDLGLYLKILFGIQLADYILLAMLALVVHVVVNQKHIGNMLTFVTLVFVILAANEGMGHKLLVYGAGPGWSYSDMRGFGPSIGAWLWFKLYWAAWALLLAVVARLLWVRGGEGGLRARLQIARSRFTHVTAATAVAATALILTLGGFIFYNTNVLNEYDETSDRMERLAEYEQQFGPYLGSPQPRLTGTSLQVELYPERQEAQIRGTYRLVNRSSVATGSVYLATDPDVETTGVAFDRPTTRVLDDTAIGRQIYFLETPLQPGEELQLSFEVRVAARGFRHEGVLPVEAAVARNGTFFTNQNWLPAIKGDAGEQIAFEAVVGTTETQIAVAPGALRRTWSEGGRRYFHYVADGPIGNQYAIFVAGYAIHEARWQDVPIQIYHHPGHTANLDRMVSSVQAALSESAERFGPYPYSQIKLIERPGHVFSSQAAGGMITFGEGFSLYNPADDQAFAPLVQAVARQWEAR